MHISVNRVNEVGGPSNARLFSPTIHDGNGAVRQRDSHRQLIPLVVELETIHANKYQKSKRTFTHLADGMVHNLHQHMGKPGR